MQQIADWLANIGLERYAGAFAANDIDVTVLRHLTDADLEDIGVSLGHRRKLLAAVAELGAAAPVSPPPALPEAKPQDAAERRQVTVMFSDLVGSTALSARMDPEDLREVMSAYQKCVAETVRRFGGYVAKYMGDGVLVYFGYPQAHEHDAERAVRAGLELTAAVAGLKTHASLQSRVGIATGLVVIGDIIGSGEAQERGIVGETPNLAARVQALAEANSVVIAPGTRRLLGDLFEYRDLGAGEVKGIAGTVRVWQVLRPSVIASRFEALRSSETPLVGRAEELKLLGSAWREATTSAGRVVLISGEPGLGKSRLTEAFGHSLDGEPHTRLRYFCSPHHQDSALYPIIGQLERTARFERGDTPEGKWDKLEGFVAGTAADEADVALLAEMLSLAPSPRHPLPDLTPQRKKERLFEALLRQLEGLTQQQPVLMIFEDIHWADPTTRELLDATIARVAHLPVLLLATFRLEFQPPWSGYAHVASVSPRRLEPSDSGALIRGIAGGAAGLSDALVAEIVERTDGVPLFVEELTKAVLESAPAETEDGRNTVVAAVPAVSLAVPPTLHASLMARLERLGPTAKEIAQVGAALGRDFSNQVLAAAVPHGASELEDALRRLVDAGLILQSGELPDATFLFKHALIQDTAYGMLLRAPRQALHARIARTLEQGFPAVVATQPHVLARHFTEAGLVEKALVYWLRAGQQAVAKSALVEAVSQLRRGVRLAAEMPDASLRSRHELDFQIALASALVAMKGYAHPEVVEAFERARGLILATNDIGTIAHFSVLYGLAAANYHAGRPSIALEQVKEFLSLAEAQQDSGPLLQGHRLIGFVQITIGDYPSAFAHAERAVTLYVPEQHRTLAFSADIGVQALCLSARALWHRGYPERASRTAAMALQSARQSGHRQTLAYALVYIGLMEISARRDVEVDALATEALVVAREHGFALFSGIALIFQGWAMALRDPGPASIERIREGLAATQATGARTYQPIFLGLLAEALALTGETEQGLTVLAEALAAAEISGAKGHVAELHRLHGDLLRRRVPSDQAGVEVCLRTALDVAREQGTRGYELRAATCLARLWRDQGKRDEARDLLAPVYGSFTEGFDTVDLNEAKLLLDELGPAMRQVRARHRSQG
jgi:class 3 adenylate cyclase/predicted ATPase